MPVIVEEDQSLFDVLKLSDPGLVKSIIQIKNNTNVENQLNLMLDRSKGMVEKYEELVLKIREYGVDFIMPLGRTAIQGGMRDKERQMMKKSPSKRKLSPLYNSGFFSSLEKAPVQYQVLCKKIS